MPELTPRDHAILAAQEICQGTVAEAQRVAGYAREQLWNAYDDTVGQAFARRDQALADIELLYPKEEIHA